MSTTQEQQSAFTRFVEANLPRTKTIEPIDRRLAIAETVVDLIDMGCNARTVHNMANWYRIEWGFRPVHIPDAVLALTNPPVPGPIL